MKIIAPLICTLFLVGCNDTTPVKKTAPIQNTNVISSSQSEAVVPQTTEIKTTKNKVDSIKTETKPVNKIKSESEVQSKHAEVDAQGVFDKKCASCHGVKADKQALGKSQVIEGWEASKIEEALNGYKSGAYGREMKAVMQGQAKSLNTEEIKSLAKYIEKL